MQWYEGISKFSWWVITKYRFSFVTGHCCPLLSLYNDSNVSACAASTAGTHFLGSCVGRSEIHHHHHHLPPWIRSFDLFQHQHVAIISWGVHNLFVLRVCNWGCVLGVCCYSFSQGGWFNFVCICFLHLVFQGSLVLFLWFCFLFCQKLFLNFMDILEMLPS